MKIAGKFFVYTNNSGRKKIETFFTGSESPFKSTKQKPKIKLHICFIESFEVAKIGKTHAKNKTFKLNVRQ